MHERKTRHVRRLATKCDLTLQFKGQHLKQPTSVNSDSYIEHKSLVTYQGTKARGKERIEPIRALLPTPRLVSACRVPYALV